MRSAPDKEETKPHVLPFKMFEHSAKDLGAPCTALQEAPVRNRLESAYGELKKVRKEFKKDVKEKERQAARGSAPGSSSRKGQGPAKGKDKDSLVAARAEQPSWSGLRSEVETHAQLWEIDEYAVDDCGEG